MRNQSAEREELVAFLGTICRPGQQIDGGDDDVNLFDAGLLDSLAVIQIILYLEQHHGINLIAAGIDPSGLGTIAGMLEAIERAP